MKLIALLLCLALERGVDLGKIIPRTAVWTRYSSLLEKPVTMLREKVPALGAPISLAVMVFPLWLVFGILYFIMHSWVLGLGGLILHLVVLCLCIGPHDTLMTAIARVGDEALGRDTSACRSLTNDILTNSNGEIMTVMFWYMLPAGSLWILLYRLADQVPYLAGEAEEGNLTATIVSVFTWLPARLTVLAYALVGHFAQTSAYLLENLMVGLGSDDTLLQEGGALALGLKEDANTATTGEVNEAIVLVTRTVMIYLGVFAVFTIGGWLS